MRVIKNETIAEYIQRYSACVEQELSRVFPIDWEIPDKLNESMAYSLMAGGKRMRPILVIAAAEAFGAPPQTALPAACAVELIHTYSLIHDDLPAMDNDDFRRGKPTNHKVFGEAMAILAGDALLTHAFYCLIQCYRKLSVPAERVLSMIEELSLLAGASGLVGGQAADMLGEQGITGLAELEYIHIHKTSDLIVYSLRAGGRIGGADEKQLDALTLFGRRIGLAFQVRDDILDIVGDQGALGKNLKSDEKLNKVTYPYLIGLDASIRKVEQLTEEGKRAVLEADIPNARRLLELADVLMSRNR